MNENFFNNPLEWTSKSESLRKGTKIIIYTRDTLRWGKEK